MATSFSPPLTTEQQPQQSRTSEDDDQDVDMSSSYIDYLAFLSPTFSPPAFANILTLQTNTPHDPSLDLSTPLSRIQFDIQEIDSHILTLTTKASLPLLTYAQQSQLTSTQLVEGLESELKRLTETYSRLEADVITRAKSAKELYLVVSRLHDTTTLLRTVTRTLLLGRELESQMFEVKGIPTIEKSQKRISEIESFKAMPRAARTAVELQKVLTGGSAELEELDIIRSLRTSYIQPAVNLIASKSQGLVSNFGINAQSGGGKAALPTSIQYEESRTKLVASFQTLQILSSIDRNTTAKSSLLTKSVQNYLHGQARSWFEGLQKGGLTDANAMDRQLSDLENRTKSITFLEGVLNSIPHTNTTDATKASPPKPSQDSDSDSDSDSEESSSSSNPSASTYLTPILAYLDAPTIPTAFFKIIAQGLEPRIQEILQRGGNNARSLRSLRNVLRDGLRDAVRNGLSSSTGGADVAGGKKNMRSNAEVGVCFGALQTALAPLK